MFVCILSQQLDNKVHMLVELTKHAFVLLLELLHPGFNMLSRDAFGPVVLQSVYAALDGDIDSRTATLPLAERHSISGCIFQSN